MLIDLIKTKPEMEALVKRYPAMLKANNIIYCGSDPKGHYEASVSQLKVWVEYVGRDDPWMEPGMLPPQLVLYNLHPQIIQAERELFAKTMDLNGHQLWLTQRAKLPSVYTSSEVQLMWEVWLAARLGFTGVFK